MFGTHALVRQNHAALSQFWTAPAEPRPGRRSLTRYFTGASALQM